MFAYCLNNPVNNKDPNGAKPWNIDKDGNPQKDNTIIYQVPCLNQGNKPLCWAYSIFMRKCYEFGKVLSKEDQEDVVKSWGLLYQFLFNHDIGLPFCLQGEKASMGSINDLYNILLDKGPGYAAYGIPFTTKGHIVLVTGVDLENNLVYTNNPWGEKGVQSFIAFYNGFYTVKYYEDPRFQLFGIYTEF